MAAHLRPLTKCQHPGCVKPAVEALYTTRNDLVAVYCATHAAPALKAWHKEYPEQA